MEAGDRAADAAHAEVEEHPDGRRPAAHHLVHEGLGVDGQGGSSHRALMRRGATAVFAPAQASWSGARSARRPGSNTVTSAQAAILKRRWSCMTLPNGRAST